MLLFVFLMIRRPPRSTRTDHSFPTRRSSDLSAGGASIGLRPLAPGGGGASFHGRRQPPLRHPGDGGDRREGADQDRRSEEHTSELQSLMRISYAVFCLKKKKQQQH